MVFTEIIGAYSEIHTKPINRACWENACILMLKQVVPGEYCAVSWAAARGRSSKPHSLIITPRQLPSRALDKPNLVVYRCEISNVLI
jgi:hypothetical protein